MGRGSCWLESAQRAGFTVFAGWGWGTCSAQPTFNIRAPYAFKPDSLKAMLDLGALHADLIVSIRAIVANAWRQQNHRYGQEDSSDGLVAVNKTSYVFLLRLEHYSCFNALALCLLCLPMV